MTADRSRSRTPQGTTLRARTWRAPESVMAALEAEAARTGVAANLIVTTAVTNYLAAPTSPFVQLSGLVSSSPTNGTSAALTGATSPVLNTFVVTDYRNGLAAVEDRYSDAVAQLAGTPEEAPCTSTPTPPSTGRRARSRSAPTAAPAESAPAAAAPGTGGPSTRATRSGATQSSPRRSSASRAATTRARSALSQADPKEQT